MILAARNGVYGLAMAPVLTGRLPRRLLAAQLVLDESTAMATAQADEHEQRTAFWATGLTIFVLWNVGTFLGALAGTAIDPQTFGLDAAFPAAYLAMVVPHLRHRTGLWAGVAGAAICLVLIPFTPVGVPILCASAAILLGIPLPRDASDSPGRRGHAGRPVTWALVLAARRRRLRLQGDRARRHRLAPVAARRHPLPRPRARRARSPPSSSRTRSRPAPTSCSTPGRRASARRRSRPGGGRR